MLKPPQKEQPVQNLSVFLRSVQLVQCYTAKSLKLK